MSVIKCSNCENEILDTEIVCPYCDCPISETIKKMKSDDLKSYTDKAIDDLTGKIPVVKADEEPKIATSSDFEKEKAAILKDIPKESPIEGANTEIGKTVKISRSEAISKPSADELATKATAAAEQRKNTALKKKAPKKKLGRKKIEKYIILAVTIVGIIIAGLLVKGLMDDINKVQNKNNKPNKKTTVVKSDADEDKELGFDFHSSTLTISDDELMKDYESSSEAPWYQYKDKIKHVTIGSDVTKIGAYAFEGFENITDVTIPNSVISIGDYAFYNCTSLTKVKMSEDLEEIGSYAFTGCTELKKIPGYTEEADFEPTIRYIGDGAFKSCKSIEAMRLPMYTEIGAEAFLGHGDDFVLICEPGGDVYKYAAEKGIPTKLSFSGSVNANAYYQEPSSEDDENPSSTSKTDTKKEETKKDNTGSTGNTQTPSASGNNAGSENTSTPAAKPSVSDLMSQLEKATTQAEKDKILTEIDKITQ